MAFYLQVSNGKWFWAFSFKISKKKSFKTAKIRVLQLFQYFKATNCNPNPCSNGGTCGIDTLGTEYCLCLTGFTGSNCDTGCSKI